MTTPRRTPRRGEGLRGVSARAARPGFTIRDVLDPPGSSSTQADLHRAYKDRFEAEQDLNPTGQRKRVMHTSSWKSYVEKARYLGLLEVVGAIDAVTSLPDAMAYLLALTPAGRRPDAPWDSLVRAFSEAEDHQPLRGPV